MLGKYNINDVVYFATNTQVVKMKIEEKFIHYKQDETLVKYAARPYGTEPKNCFTISDNDVHDNFEDAKKESLSIADRQTQKMYSTIEEKTEALQDVLEAEYQKGLQK